MVSPRKRAQRARREVHNDAVVEDSSPSRPSKRRKKTEDPPSEPTEEGDSSLQADQTSVNPDDDDQIVTRVTQHLTAPETPVQASRDHSNSIHESNKEGVKAYAKIAAQDWTYYVTKLVVNIGRGSEPTQRRLEQGANHDDDEDASAVHIDLGPSKIVSREHASIFFNGNEAKWWLRVKGRNALKVNGQSWRQNESGPLSSGDVMEIGGVEMMFVLPTELSPLHVQRQYLERANLAQKVASEVSRLIHPGSAAGDSFGMGSSPGKSQRGLGLGRSLAPAPPDYKRPGTPPSVRARMSGLHATPHHSGPGLVASGIQHDLDLSKDENKQVKPQFSYAQMITQAIISTKEEKLNLAGIYSFILSNYSYYRNQAPSGWQNSIRHNLSLNKAFEKVARSSDEPGKGMKWQLVAESRDEMIHNAYRGGRGGHRGSSAPSSPSQLSYINTGPNDIAARDLMQRNRRKVSPSGSPQPRTALRESLLTPVRGGRKPLPDEPGSFGADGSPLPRLRKPNTSSTLGMVENAPGSPTLTSSYLQEDGASFVTPAPHRVHPKLAPPSTAQRPSQHMPTSSPAPFWKYADYGSTPLKPAQLDLSPSKLLGQLPPQSSSPPPRPSKSPIASPTRPNRAAAEEPPSPAEPEEDRGFDLTKGFQSIGSFHAPVGQGKQVQPASNGDLGAPAPVPSL